MNHQIRGFGDEKSLKYEENVIIHIYFEVPQIDNLVPPCIVWVEKGLIIDKLAYAMNLYRYGSNISPY